MIELIRQPLVIRPNPTRVLLRPFLPPPSSPRTLRILSAFLTENRITEGPFLAAPIAFNVIE